ncbi:collagen alpha-1(I) chain-like [Acinonyx jubatus]|uniref:Collagen alpha-1(I) chain-like n=1 Tax=Acinonyx jubatus TaxID=32536 RepID=A0ABM3NDY2_ACIJB|nr:collagen alpha-1(I) chain-like [Acinonyx jubatus]
MPGPHRKEIVTPLARYWLDTSQENGSTRAVDPGALRASKLRHCGSFVSHSRRPLEPPAPLTGGPGRLGVLLEETKHQKPPWRARAAPNWPRGGRGRDPGSLADLRCGEAGVPGGSGRPRAKSRSGPGAHAAALPDSLAPGAGAGRFGALPAAAAPRAPRGAAARAPPARRRRGPSGARSRGLAGERVPAPALPLRPPGVGEAPRSGLPASHPPPFSPSPRSVRAPLGPGGGPVAAGAQPPPPPHPPPREDGARAFWLPPVGARRTQPRGPSCSVPRFSSKDKNVNKAIF